MYQRILQKKKDQRVEKENHYAIFATPNYMFVLIFSENPINCF